MIAVVQLSTQTVVASFRVEHEASVRVELPDGSSVSPIILGWESGDFAVWTMTETPLPAGELITGAPAVEFDFDTKTVIVSWPSEPVPVNEVSRRQFKMQLAISGLMVAAESWVADQDVLVKIAYAESGSFRRDDAMLMACFTALGFSEEQVDAFFRAASLL